MRSVVTIFVERLRVVAVMLVALALFAPAAAADSPTGPILSGGLLDEALASPKKRFDVVITGRRGASAEAVAFAVRRATLEAPDRAAGLRRKLSIIRGAAAQLTGNQLVKLAADPNVAVITPDGPVGGTDLTNSQLWPAAAGVPAVWGATGAPAIAIVDSGVDSTRAADFGARVVTSQTFVSGGQTPGIDDSRGHGTLVAGLAAGQAPGYAGAAPGANIVSLDVLGDDGSGVLSDVIAAADWILANKDAYGIRVANFSLTGSTDSSFMYDPLDQAVERLWFSGVVVVAAAGNYGDTLEGVRYAPGNDPFVITVGAADVNGSADPADDFAAPWSARGYTFDGFRKPELGAPGRLLRGPVPTTSTMYAAAPARHVGDGYMWMSGTSFAAPVVAGIAAQILAVHPGWTPDQVKGALMLAAKGYAESGSLTLGVGLASAAGAAAVVDPPNPNEGLNAFVTSDGQGGQMFDSASWASAAQSSASWSSASWSSASWSSASWSSASWSSASWSSASWSSASWSSASWASASWSSASWASLSWVG